MCLCKPWCRGQGKGGNVAEIVQGQCSFPRSGGGDSNTRLTPKCLERGKWKGINPKPGVVAAEGQFPIPGVLASLGIPLEVMDPSLSQLLPSSHSCANKAHSSTQELPWKHSWRSWSIPVGAGMAPWVPPMGNGVKPQDSSSGLPFPWEPLQPLSLCTQAWRGIQGGFSIQPLPPVFTPIIHRVLAPASLGELSPGSPELQGLLQSEISWNPGMVWMEGP